MYNRKRKLFWDTLCSLKGVDIESESQQLETVIPYPRYIYRFRPASISSLAQLEQNRLYFSSADHYDDPFDTYLHIDSTEIRNSVASALQNTESLHMAAMQFSYMSGMAESDILKTLSEIPLDKIQDAALKLFGNIRTMVQKESYSICFSEDGFNEALWLKYAEHHRGFVLEYDIRDSQNLLCGQFPFCAACSANGRKYPLYPIYYSSQPYNATGFAQKIAVWNILNTLPFSDNVKQDYLSHQPYWERERISLIKHKCHEYDKEWRIIFPAPITPAQRPCFCWRPRSVIMGLRATEDTKQMIIACAQKAGIERIFQCVLSSNGKLHSTPVK